MLRLLATLLLALAVQLSAAEAPTPAPLASPSGKLHLRLGDSTPLPGAITPVQERAGEDEEATQTLVLEEKGRPPFTVTAPEGRCTPPWSADESYLALAIQTDRANFPLLILRLSDRPPPAPEQHAVCSRKTRCSRFREHRPIREHLSRPLKSRT